jgi:hypothetical protein
VNVYIKLQKARVDLQNMDLKKSGENKFAGYDYFELGDFMPAINKLFADIGLFSQVSFTNELATLIIINTDKPDEQIVFTSPMAEANLKGCHPIQNAGAVQSYQRRYLYMAALEIVEQDALDKTTGKDNEKPQKNAPQAPQGSQNRPSNTPTQTTSQQSQPAASNSVTSDKVSPPQLGMIAKLKKEKQVSDDAYRRLLETKFSINSSKDLSKRQATEFIKYLQDTA